MLSAKPLTLLTIEDDPIVRRGLVKYFEGLGYYVEQAADGIEGIELFQSVLPDLVITDLRLPGLDGLQVIEQIKALSEVTPVVVFSGMGTLNDAIKALRLGAADYITKPLTDFALIKHTVDRALERTRLLEGERKYQQYLEMEVERKTAELHQAQKLEAIGTLAGGIAHDFNNILAVISGHAELALLNTSPKSTLADDLKQILAASDRAKELVLQILNFGRKSSKKRSPLNISVIIKEIIKMLRSTFPATAQLHLHISAEKPLIMMDPVELHQIITNICTNALHALPEECGNITIRIDKHTQDVNIAPIKTGQYLQFSIEDDGVGIQQEHLLELFKPFFTTKAKGEGTGLGLSVVHEIVIHCDGHIWVESEIGKGSVFKMLFPLVDKEVDNNSLEIQDTLPNGSEKILFIDDEEGVNVAVKRMLKFLGYTVCCCMSAEEALQELEKNNGDFDLIISDQSMPQMPGSVLVEKLGVLYPDIAILLCTGHSSVIDREQAIELGASDLLMKPVGIHLLANKIRSILDKK